MATINIPLLGKLCAELAEVKGCPKGGVVAAITIVVFTYKTVSI